MRYAENPAVAKTLPPGTLQVNFFNNIVNIKLRESSNIIQCIGYWDSVYISSSAM